MPSALESLAALIQNPVLNGLPTARMERLRLHIADSLGMMLEGAKLAEGKWGKWGRWGKAALAAGSRPQAGALRLV